MHFVFTGFKHVAASRVFEFEGIAADATRTNYFVSADLMLVRRYGIRVQELPLLCLRYLEDHQFSDDSHALTYAEEDMRLYTDCRAAERDAAQRNKGSRRARESAAQN